MSRHEPLLQAAFIISTESSPKGDDDEEDRSLVYVYPPPNAGNIAASVNSFKSLGLAVRGILDSVCGEKTKLVQLEKDGDGLLMAFCHLEACMFVLALRNVVLPDLATALTIHLAETLLLLLGPFTQWSGEPQAGSSGFGLHAEAQAILDRVFEAVLRQLDTPGWALRLAPWQSFEDATLYLVLPPALQQRLGGIVASHASQTVRSPFSFFRRHSCLMYRGLLLGSDLQPQHTKQLWQLCWCLGVFQHSAGLPCQVLTRIVHLSQGMVAIAGGPGAPNVTALADAAVTVSEQAAGRSLLVLAAACNLTLAVVLTAYDEEIEEELAGRLEGHSAAELLQKIHTSMGSDLDRLVDASAAYSSTTHALDGSEQPSALRPAPSVAGHAAKAATSSSLFMKLMMRHRSTAHRAAAAAAAAAPLREAQSQRQPQSPEAGESGSSDGGVRSPLMSPAGSNATVGSAVRGSPLHSPGGPSAPDKSVRGAGPASTPPLPLPLPPQLQPVAAPEGAVLVIAHDPLQGTVRLLGDVPGGPAGGAGAGVLPGVWQAVQTCHAKFGAHNVAVAAPPKHSRLTMTLDQIEQLSAARSQREGGQRLGTADSSPWQYHPEVASLAAVQQITIKLPPSLPAGAGEGGAGGGGRRSNVGGGGGSGGGEGLYLTASLHQDMRELFVVHGASVDEARVVEGLWDSTAGKELWPRESLGMLP